MSTKFIIKNNQGFELSQIPHSFKLLTFLTRDVRS